MSVNSNPIGILDSGFGGITVLKRLLKLLPNENYIYFGDNANIPYGSKSKDEILKLSSRMVNFLIEKKCKMLVIACNTISASSYEILKEKYNIPIMEVVSNACLDFKKTDADNVSIMATEFTVKSKIYERKIKEYNNDIKITQIACKKLCPMIENDWESYKDRFDILKNYIKDIDSSSDTLILACTHYPLIIKDIKKLLRLNKKNIKKIIDPSFRTALSIKSALKENNILNKKNNGNLMIYTTSNDAKKTEKLLNIFLNKNEYKIKYLDL